LRDDYERFQEAGAEVLAISAESAASSEAYLRAHPLPYPTLIDEDHTVFDAYDATSRLMSLGQRPALFVVDAAGVIRFGDVGAQQWNIPSNQAVLSVLQGL
jgi:thioredoxin-dependent peroxiredoxin